MTLLLVTFSLLLIVDASAFAQDASPEPISRHRVGWINTLLPGGGAAALGHSGQAITQSFIEISSFAYGYSLSPQGRFTLDGATENLPLRSSTQEKETDLSRSLNADFWQEIGLKYHMVNVYNSYREASGVYPHKNDNKNSQTGQGIDDSTTESLFAAPFKWANIADPYVYAPLIISAAYHIYAFQNEEHQQLARLNSQSQQKYKILYGAVYPLGSAAPEEMFYRGFMQNEFFELSQSQAGAISLSTAAYTLSHSPDSYFSAGVSGFYLGMLAFHENGRLSKNICFHFWSDVIMGLHAIASLSRDQQDSTPILFQYGFSF